MKVGLVLDHFDPRRGGVEQWTKQFADELLRLGHEVHVIASGFGEEHSARRRSPALAQRVRSDRISCGQCPAESGGTTNVQGQETRAQRSLSVPGIIPHRFEPARTRVGCAEAVEKILRTLDLDVIHDMGIGWHCDILQPHGGSRTASFEHNLLIEPRWLRPLKRLATAILPRYRDFDRLLARQYVDEAKKSSMNYFAQRVRAFRMRMEDGGWKMDSDPPSSIHHPPNSGSDQPGCSDRPAPIVLALSQMVRGHLQKFHKVAPDRIRLIYNGVDTERFSPACRDSHRETIRRQFNLRDEVLFLIVAHNFKLKGVPALLQAAHLLGRRQSNFHVAVVGGKRTKTYQRMAARLGIERFVTFVGSVDDSLPYYAAADVYVQPTFYDPCSLVVLEALACGLPVITTRFNGAGELMTPEVHGYLLDDPADAATLAGQMERLLDAGRRTSMGTAARALSLKHTLSHNVAQVLAVYDEVLAAKRSELRRPSAA